MPDRLRTYRQTVEADIATRINTHQGLIAARAPIAGVLPLNLLAHGDSWFDYPLIDDLPVGSSDVIARLRGLIRPGCTILDLAHHGDATTEMLGVTRRAALLQALHEKKNGTFDAILFSGGGNDLAGDQFRLWLNDAQDAHNDPAQALNTNAVADILGVIATAYGDLVATRDQFDRNLPIFVHGYDFAEPNDQGVCGLGPWLFPSLQSRGWMNSVPADLATGRAIVRALLEQFQNFLTGLARRTPNVIVVPTQGTLAPAEWANELHPTPGGFDKIAGKFAAALASRFPGRVIAPAAMPAMAGV